MLANPVTALFKPQCSVDVPLTVWP